MKKLNYLVVIALLFVGIFSSCKKDTTSNPPSISFDNYSSYTLPAGVTSWTITGKITSDAGLSTVKYFKVDSIGNESQIGASVTSFSDANNFSFTQTLTGITSLTKLKVQATDSKDQTVSSIFTINVASSAVAPTSYPGKEIGSYNNVSFGSSFASLDGTVYSLANAKTNSSLVDFIYYYSSANNASISAPADASVLSVYFTSASAPGTWTVQNNTKLLKVTGVDFANVTSAQINALSPTDLHVQNLVVGDIFAFQTASTNTAFPNKKGVAQVVSVTGTDAGSIVLNIKVAN